MVVYPITICAQKSLVYLEGSTAGNLLCVCVNLLWHSCLGSCVCSLCPAPCDSGIGGSAPAEKGSEACPGSSHRQPQLAKRIQSSCPILPAPASKETNFLWVSSPLDPKNRAPELQLSGDKLSERLREQSGGSGEKTGIIFPFVFQPM